MGLPGSLVRSSTLLGAWSCRWQPSLFAGQARSRNKPISWALHGALFHATAARNVKLTLEQCYQVLELSEDATKEQVRERYLQLAKDLHPDSGSVRSDSAMFTKVAAAYSHLMKALASEESKKATTIEDFWQWYEEQMGDIERKAHDIRHTAPQHRQYLEYGGLGMGTPFQRQKQYQQQRVRAAFEGAVEKQYEKAVQQDGSVESKRELETKKYTRRQKTTNFIDRMVEDMIQEAMKKGEFENLQGKGKPLKEQINHHVDRTTEKINEVLINSGCLPEWIQQEKDIRDAMDVARRRLDEAWQRCGPEPMPQAEEDRWKEALRRWDSDVADINRMVDKFNLIVPIMSRQRLHVNKAKVLAQVQATFTHPHGQKPQLKNAYDQNTYGIGGFLTGLFFGRA